MSTQTKVTLFKGGTKEHTVRAGAVVIPDLWHIAQAIKERGKLKNGPACAEMILDCWHIAGALRQHIIEH